jgi:2-polyprenyl-3-methyl-5-hydroxy-6-metoxy-1,4-benzoquinol methylase
VVRDRGLQAECGTIWSHTLDGGFDVIWMSHVVEHVHRPVDVLRRCRALLVPGGTLVAVTPNSESWGYQIFGGAWRGLEPPRHLHVFSRRALMRAAQSAGFADVEVRVTIRNARGIHSMSQAIREAERTSTQVDPPSPTLGDELWQLREWLRTFRREEDGEELVLIARTDSLDRPHVASQETPVA